MVQLRINILDESEFIIEFVCHVVFKAHLWLCDAFKDEKRRIETLVERIENMLKLDYPISRKVYEGLKTELSFKVGELTQYLYTSDLAKLTEYIMLKRYEVI